MKDDRQWPMAAKNYANTRYSSLDQINAGNVSQLKLAWSFSVGPAQGKGGALAVNGTVFVVAPYDGPHPNQIFALDGVTGDSSGHMRPNPTSPQKALLVVMWSPAGLAYDNGKIFLNTLDDYSVAIDANTGKELWHTRAR